MALPLYIDIVNKQLVAGINSGVPPQLPPFVQGDQFDVDLYFLRPTGSVFAPFENIAVDDLDAIRIGIGKIIYATGGTWYVQWPTAQTSGALVVGKHYVISTFVAGDNFTNVGAVSNATGVIFTATGTTPTTWTHSSVLNEITTDLAYNITAGALDTALEAMNAIGVGNVGVTGDYQAGFQIEFIGTKGYQAISTLAADADNIIPDALATIQTIRSGSANQNALQKISVQPLVAVYASNYGSNQSPAPAPAITEVSVGDAQTNNATVSTIRNGNGTLGEIQRITFNRTPVSGSFYIANFYSGAATTAPIAWNATASQIKAALDAAAGISDWGYVTLVPGISFDINTTKVLTDFAAVTVNSAQLVTGSRRTIARVTWASPPLGGTFQLVDISNDASYTYATTGAIAFDASAGDIESAINAVLGDGAVTVMNYIAGISFDIQWTNYLPDQAVDAYVDASNIARQTYYNLTLNFNTLGLDQLLGSADKITDAILEIEVDIAGSPETVLHLEDVTIINDLVTQEIYTSTFYGTASFASDAFAPSAAGNDNVSAKAEHDVEIVAATGAGAYTRTVSFLTSGAVTGACADVYIELPASTNPTIELRNASSGGTLLHTVTGVAANARYQLVRLRYNGTTWKKRFSAFITG